MIGDASSKVVGLGMHDNVGPRLEPDAKTYLVRFKHPEKSKQTVAAAIAEVQEDYLWLFDEKGDIVGLFAIEFVESWSELRSEEKSN